MSAEANKMIARRFFDEAWNQNKVSDLDEYVSVDNVHIGDENKARPFGPDQIRELIRTWRTGLPDFQYHIQQLISENALVVTHVTFTGTHTGVFRVASRILPPTDKTINEQETIIFRIVSGKIVESWATWDRLSLLEKLGAIS